MTTPNLHTIMEDEWIRVNNKANLGKDSTSAVFALSAFYHGLSNDDRVIANEIIIGWALSNDPIKRFDGLFLIEDFSVLSAIPALNQLAKRLEKEHEPSAPYDIKKINRILKKLSAG